MLDSLIAIVIFCVALLMILKTKKYNLSGWMELGLFSLGSVGQRLTTVFSGFELLRLQDRFVYLPEMPYRKVNLDKANRNVLSQDKFEADGGQGTVTGWLNTVTVENVHPNTTVALRMKGISGETGSLNFIPMKQMVL